MKKVLVVEDERTLRDALVKKLSKEEFTVLSAKDGKEGLDTALAEHPDLILLDILMPKMNGIEVLQKLREDEWGAKAKVIEPESLTIEIKSEIDLLLALYR